MRVQNLLSLSGKCGWCLKKSWNKMFPPQIMSSPSILLFEAALKGTEDYWRGKKILEIYQRLNSANTGRGETTALVLSNFSG